MKALILIALLLLPARAFAACDFDTSDKWLLGGASALLVVDWAQTRNALARPDPVIHENNLILGRHPSPASQNLYFSSMLAGTWLMACYLPDPWRKVFLGGMTGLELSVTAQNYRVYGIWGF